MYNTIYYICWPNYIMNLKNKIEDLWFRVYRIIGRKYIQYSKNPRPSSAPFITGDGFRNIAQHVYDNSDTIVDPGIIRNGDIVFVGDSRIQSFIEKIHPHIQAKYVLITHNGDASVTSEELARVRGKIIRWYGINMLVSDPKVVPIPIGIENKHYYVCGIPSVFKKVIQAVVPKKDAIFYAFTVKNNPQERQPALDEIQKHPLGETLQQWRGFRAYLKHLNHFKFVISPPGSSIEGIRTWDSMYIGSVPIVKSSIPIDYFKTLGLPLLVIHDWSELKNITKENISIIYASLKESGNREPLYIEYWIKKIEADTKYE